MEKQEKTKILSKEPFKIKNKMEAETKVIQKIIDTITKKTVVSELFDTLNNEFEKLLLKTKDAIQAHVRAEVLTSLGYTDVATLFNAKAIELGYIVEKININEHNMLSKIELLKKIETLAPIKIANMKERIRVIERELGVLDTNYTTEEDLGDLLYLITSSPYEDDSDEYEIIENKKVNENEDLNRIDLIAQEIKKIENINTKEASDRIKYLIDLKASIQANELHNIDKLHKDNNYTFNKLIAKYPELSDVLQSNLKSVVSEFDKDNMSSDRREEIAGAIAAITGDTKENIKALIYGVQEETEYKYFGIHVKFSDNGLDPEDPNYETEGYTKYVKVPTTLSGDGDNDIVNYAVDKGLMTMEDGKLSDYVEEVTEEEFIDYTSTNENHKQHFEYSPQEETKYKIDEEAPVVKKLDYNPIALKHMISDDAFLKFSYHNLSIGNEDEDLNLIYNTYIKGEDEMLSKLKTYESYTTYILKQQNKK